MESDENKIIALTGDEFLRIGEVVEYLLNRGDSSDTPEFVIFMGGIASGKTTIRHKDYAGGFVHFDFGEIYKEIEDEFGKGEPRLAEYASFASNTILREALKRKKNIVIEIIGETQEPIGLVIDKMREVGYKISVQGITCDVKEAYARHIKATQEDKDYISAHYSQRPTLAEFYTYFGLGELPVSIE
ncbi:MAG: zeta toxin family protein [Candidatus Pacebacteria bacterium]|nr:zeta toxin family protein [Candidatus Paceibacterota bacterium]